MADSTSVEKRHSLLVVDDTPQNLSLMSDLLDSSYHVKLAPNGARALKIAASTPPDLILLDVMMPEMDGYAVCNALKADPATHDIPVIFLTAMDTQQDEERGLSMGAVDYIAKPISPAILLARVRNQLALKDAANQLKNRNQELEEEKARTRELLKKLKEATDKLLEQNRRGKQERDRLRERLQAHGIDMDTPADPTPTSTSMPQKLGRYLISQEIGQGAMGRVYLGTDPMIGRVVAIKTMAFAEEISAEILTSAKEHFFREAESAGKLVHPNIIAIYDVGEEGALCYIAMEYLKGNDLKAHTSTDRLLPIEEVLSIIERVASALSTAHAHGVIHRDIKPANIIYNPESDTVKVTDFGIASIFQSEPSANNLPMGTPSFMAPELLTGQPATPCSDIFSLGVTLFQLVTGTLPFRANTLEELIQKICREPHTDMRSFAPEIPDCVISTIDKALAKDPANRFQSAEEMTRHLNLCRRSLSIFTRA